MFLSPEPENAPEPVLAGLRSVRERLSLNWDIARLSPLGEQHLTSMDEKLLRQATWLIARTDQDFSLLPSWFPLERCISLIAHPRMSPDAARNCCTFDEERFGLLAAQHAHELGYTRVATIASGIPIHRRRQEGFVDRARQLGLDVQIYHHVKNWGPEEGEKKLMAWFDRLEKPLLVYRPIDHAAAWLRDKLRERGIIIPRDMAIIGTGDHIICTYREPRITSVAYPWFQMGAAAGMAILHKVGGNLSPELSHLIPMRVVQRESTPQIKIHDPLVRKALTFMRKNLTCSKPTEITASFLGIDASTLNRHFHKSLRRTPKQEHNRLRIERAESLLLEDPPMTLKEVAKKSGYSCADALNAAFKKESWVNQYMEKDLIFNSK